MKQTINIFMKDARRHWPEILLSTIALMYFTWGEPRAWMASAYLDTSFLRNGLPVVSLVLIWWITVARIIQGESLVGDRQFWITRPYKWPCLLGAKILFLVVFMLGPVFFSGLYLLWRAGFPYTLQTVPELAWMLVQLAAVLLLPAAVLASITETLVQFMLVVLGSALLIGGMAWLATRDAFSAPSPASDIVGYVELGLLLVGVVTVLLWQYATRRTFHGRALVAGTILAITLVMVVAPYQWLTLRAFPALNAGSLSSLRISLAPPEPGKPTGITFMREAKSKTTSGTVSLTASGFPAGEFAFVEGSRVTIDGANGFHWQSRWMEQTRALLHPGDATFTLALKVPQRTLDQLHSDNVHMTLQIAVAQYQDAHPQPVTITPGDFSLPRIGICSFPTDNYRSGEVKCRAPFGTPSLLMWTLNITDSTCPNARLSEDGNLDPVAYGSTSDDSSRPFSPVDVFSPYILATARKNGYSTSSMESLCAGTTIIVSAPVFKQRQRLSFDLPAVKIRQINQDDSPISYGFTVSSISKPLLAPLGIFTFRKAG